MQDPRFMDVSFERSRALRALSVGLVALACSAGCSIPTRVASVDTTVPQKLLPVTVDTGIAKLDEVETKRRIERLMQSPGMREIEREVIAGLLDGTLSALSEEERSKRVGALMSKALMGVMEGASTTIGPMASRMTSGAVGGALDAALDPARREALKASVGDVVSTGVRSAAEGLRDAELGTSISTAMSEQVGPALQKALRENLTRGLTEMLKDEEFRRELGATARVLGREMVIGTTEALAESKPPEESGSMLSRISQLAGKGARLFGSLAWLLGLVVLALAVWIVRLMAQAKRYREDAHRREAMAHLLEEATKASEGKPWSNELLTALNERLKADEAERAKKRPSKWRWTKRGDDDTPRISRPAHA